MLLLQEVGDLLPAAAEFTLADGPDKLLGRKAHLTGRARLLFGFLVLLQEGQQAVFCDGFKPEADGAPVFAEPLGDTGFGQPLRM